MRRYDIDYGDSEKLWGFAMETCQVAEDFADARKAHAGALKQLKMQLAKAYAANSIERKHSEDKAYLVLATHNEACKTALNALVANEGLYKGLEKVLEARQAALSFNQSLIKNQMRNA